MKRLLTLVAVSLLFAVSSHAQTIKVDKDAILKKIAKSDADIQNEKKNTKASVWIERGKIFFDAASRATSGLYAGMGEYEMGMNYGNPEGAGEVEIGGEPYVVYVYPHFAAFTSNGVVMFWDGGEPLVEDALEQAYEAYDKAYQVDPKSASRVRAGLEEIANFAQQVAANYFSLEQYSYAAAAFEYAYDMGKHPAVNSVEPAIIYNAGFLYTISQDFERGLPALLEAEERGYYNDGDVYYYIFHCYYGLGQLEQATEILQKGLASFPDNNKIIEGLIGIYNETNRDPRDILPLVETAIEADPENGILWGGLGRIYDKLGEQEEAVKALKKAIEFMPGDFTANFNLGLLYVKQGDDINKELNANVTNPSEFKEGLERVYDKYRLSIEPLETALSIYPNEPVTLELLKNVTFRLREEDGMQEKYDLYDELLERAQQ